MSTVQDPFLPSPYTPEVTRRVPLRNTRFAGPLAVLLLALLAMSLVRVVTGAQDITVGRHAGGHVDAGYADRVVRTGWSVVGTFRCGEHRPGGHDDSGHLVRGRPSVCQRQRVDGRDRWAPWWAHRRRDTRRGNRHVRGRPDRLRCGNQHSRSRDGPLPVRRVLQPGRQEAGRPSRRRFPPSSRCDGVGRIPR